MSLLTHEFLRIKKEVYRVTTINVSRKWIELAEWAASLCTANSPFPVHVYSSHPVQWSVEVEQTDAWSTSQRRKSFQALPQYFVAGKTAEVKPDDGAAGQGQRAERPVLGVTQKPARHSVILSLSPPSDLLGPAAATRSLGARSFSDASLIFSLYFSQLTDSLASSRQGERISVCAQILSVSIQSQRCGGPCAICSCLSHWIRSVEHRAMRAWTPKSIMDDTADGGSFIFDSEQREGDEQEGKLAGERRRAGDHRST